MCRSERDDALIELARTARQDLGAIGRDEDVVLDADAPPVGQIDTGLAGNDHAGLERDVGAGAEERGLVNLQTEAMAETMIELVAEALLGDVAARARIDLLAGYAGPHG